MKLRATLSNNRGYILFAFMLVFLGGLLGVLFQDELQQLMETQIEKIRKLAEHTDGIPLKMALAIFWNNAIVSAVSILFGVLLSVVPIFVLITNGMLVGYVLTTADQMATIPLWALLVFGILPHGILEIPAFILAGAMGIKLGYMWIWPLPGKNRGASFLQAVKETLRLMPLILVLLAAAAGIEGFITPQLLLWYIK